MNEGPSTPGLRRQSCLRIERETRQLEAEARGVRRLAAKDRVERRRLAVAAWPVAVDTAPRPPSSLAILFSKTLKVGFEILE